MKINFNDKNLNVPEVKECKGLNQIIGLMFSRQEKANALVFSFLKPTKMAIHSFFVFFPFLAVWLDNKNEVIEIKKVNPFIFRVSSANSYYKLLEIPFNKKYQKIYRLLMRK